MTDRKMMDHLFRHQYGKMVSILTRIFGLHHLDMVEDAVQDTFINAMKSWRDGPPENPEAWLTKSAKNRVLDLLRKVKAEDTRISQLDQGNVAMAMAEIFLDSEIMDSQLRMIFAACHPQLDPRDQIAFALKTIAGFSQSEIAASLLLKEETVKKRLVRARKVISSKDISFTIPQGQQLEQRLPLALQVIYVIFNEGFHSSSKQALIREDLCGEGLRLAKILLSNPLTATPEAHALFALLCFQAARLKTKIGPDGEVISLDKQDRSQWYGPLVGLGHFHMEKAVKSEHFSTYHYEAAIAAEHVKAHTYEATDWDRILNWYEQLQAREPSVFNELNMAVVHLQRQDYEAAKRLLDNLDHSKLEQRTYLFYGTYAEYYKATGQLEMAEEKLKNALKTVNNDSEKRFLLQKQLELTKN